MKTKLNLISKFVVLFLLFAKISFSQCTPGPLSLITPVGTNVNIINGGLNIPKSICLPNTTALSDGVIYKGGDRFLHNFGQDNTFLGVNSGNFNPALTGFENTSVGMNSLTSLTTGYYNTAVGWSSLNTNTIGTHNTALGVTSLYSNLNGYSNTALGAGSLYYNTAGNQNTAVGWAALNFNTSGNLNSAVGIFSLFNNTTGNSNSALGDSAGFNITTGSNNTAIGQHALVPNGTASNQVQIGNTFVTYAGVQVAWTITSDRRLKSNINNSNLGLNFISKLNPVSYTRNNDESQKSEYGFIAQEVEEVLKESGVDNSGIINIDDKGTYSVRYNDLLAPMVKAIQELKEKNDALVQNNEKLALSNENLKSEVESLKSMNEKIVNLEKTVNELTSVKHTSLINEVVNSTTSK